MNTPEISNLTLEECERLTEVTVGLGWLPVELVFDFPGIEGIKLSPVRVAHKILVCFNCGYTQLVVPPAKLEQLKKGICKVRSTVA